MTRPRGFYHGYVLPVSILSGTIIGAGIFSLPFIFQRAGFFLGFIFLLLATVAYILLYLMYADVIIATPGHHDFVGYADRYGGTFLYWVSIFIAVVQMIFVLTAYLVLAGSFFILIGIGESSTFNAVLFWMVGSVLFFINLRRIAFIELIITSAIIAIIALLFILGIQRSAPISFFGAPRSFSFFPLAPILFSLAGRTAIRSVVDYLNPRKGTRFVSHIRRVIVFGTLVPAFVNLVFVIGVLSLTPIITDDAVRGLIGFIPESILIAVGFLGVFSLLSSYGVIGINIGDILRYDLRLPLFMRISIVLGGPLVLYFLGFKNFLVLVSFIGGVFLALEAFVIMYLWFKARSKTNTIFPYRKGVAVGFIFLIFSIAFIAELSVLF
ncbi:MAG: hypothetical protein COU08_01085 [Candidatus Harrisonbacteria bacterium CG10_big_fil_rev_8_21_14_0_10_42_17]|uniref:Amino acid transporter transmembrane domain-containing protein n=1 Tax=Candidatus Harrisonbacteria bacterium CG10_big_fil_rev_8_21_14_0_10_42_17 TaxID=1974584 RepID=A0A2M6WJ08_9BACT|nr:MAG: hypothetical protein COU08_01085 [Candidatus Harrisonbacteria bacterium CG10_big_fil_rev_8_21_14_0_10_42_17]